MATTDQASRLITEESSNLTAEWARYNAAETQFNQYRKKLIREIMTMELNQNKNFFDQVQSKIREFKSDNLLERIARSVVTGEALNQIEDKFIQENVHLGSQRIQTVQNLTDDAHVEPTIEQEIKQKTSNLNIQSKKDAENEIVNNDQSQNNLPLKQTEISQIKLNNPNEDLNAQNKSNISNEPTTVLDSQTKTTQNQAQQNSSQNQFSTFQVPSNDSNVQTQQSLDTANQSNQNNEAQSSKIPTSSNNQSQICNQVRQGLILPNQNVQKLEQSKNMQQEQESKQKKLQKSGQNQQIINKKSQEEQNIAESKLENKQIQIQQKPGKVQNQEEQKLEKDVKIQQNKQEKFQQPQQKMSEADKKKAKKEKKKLNKQQKKKN